MKAYEGLIPSKGRSDFRIKAWYKKNKPIRGGPRGKLCTDPLWEQPFKKDWPGSSYFKPRCISFLRGAGPPQYPLEMEKVLLLSSCMYYQSRVWGKCFLVYSHKILYLLRHGCWEFVLESLCFSEVFILQGLPVCAIQPSSGNKPVTSKVPKILRKWGLIHFFSSKERSQNRYLYLGFTWIIIATLPVQDSNTYLSSAFQ